MTPCFLALILPWLAWEQFWRHMAREWTWWLEHSAGAAVDKRGATNHVLVRPVRVEPGGERATFELRKTAI
jgi:hypothetical protein